MIRALALALAAVVIACGTGVSAPTAPGAPIKMRVNWTAVTGGNGGLWTAAEAGYYRQEGLEVELTHIASSSRSIDAMLANEVQLGWVDARNLVEAAVRGADVKGVLGVTNRLGFAVMVASSVKSPIDLKGKRLGITRFGSATHTAALQALRTWGLDQKDVTMLQLTEVPNILAAMQAGQIEAGILSAPTTTRAKKAGFVPLLNLETDGPAYPSIMVAGRTSYIDANRDAVRRFVRAYSRGLQRYRTDKDFGIATLRKYLELSDREVLEDTWQEFSRFLAAPPYIIGIEAVIADVAADEPKARGAVPEQFVDLSFVKQEGDSGFFTKLFGP